MDKKDLINLAKDSKYISGIYNYCDRWCERCAMTARCLNYAIEMEEFHESASRDVNNKLFWDKLQSIFQLTVEMVRDLARERGIDLNSLDLESTANERSQSLEGAKHHELSLAAHEYAEMADKWFMSGYPSFDQKQDELNTMLGLGVSVDKQFAKANDIADAVEVIRWFQYQIYVKLMRALSQDEMPDSAEEELLYQKDSDGSALVALLGIERSIGAWGRLHEHFPEKADSILDILIHLDRLLKNVEQAFPDARRFKRPGFDEMPPPNERS